MRTLITLLVLTTTANLSAQPLIDSTWTPLPGVNFVLQAASYNELPFNIYGDTGIGLAGNNVTWDFSKLQLLNSYDTIHYSGTNDSLVRTDMNSSVTLYWNGNDQFETNFPWIACGIIYYTGGIYYDFPIADTMIFTGDANGSGSIFNEIQYKGWGKLILPRNVQYSNVLMVEQSTGQGCEDILSDDDVVNCPISGYSQETDSYQWIVPLISNPVLTINISQINQNNYNWTGEPCSSGYDYTSSSDTTTTAWVYHNGFYTGVNDVSLNNDLGLFPNPTNDLLHLSTSRPDAATISIYNTLGELVKQQKFTPVINISELTAGYYILSVQFPEGTAMKQFVKL